MTTFWSVNTTTFSNNLKYWKMAK